MIKKYVMIIAMLLAILIFTSTSTASFLFPEGKIYERLPENSPLRNILDRFSQIASDGKDSMSIDTNDEYYDGNDVDDGDIDDGEYDDDDTKDGLEKDGRLPKIWNMVGEITTDGGNEPVDDLEDTSTVDSDGEDGLIQDTWTVDSNGEEGTTDEKIMAEEEGADGATRDEWTVDSDGDEGEVSNEITIPDYIDEGEWTVEAKPMTVKLERFVKIVTELNGNLGAMLQRVIERTVATDKNGVSSPGSGGSAENDIVDNIVLTDGDQ